MAAENMEFPLLDQEDCSCHETKDHRSQEPNNVGRKLLMSSEDKDIL
jgi:hypothetical protein